MSRAQARLQQAAMRLFAERGVTQVTVSDLAEEAGVARGTVYSNLTNPDSLFEDVATRLTAEMEARVAAASVGTADPAQRVADAIRFFVRRAHEDPLWGRFLVRFGATTPTLRGLFARSPMSDVRSGVEQGRFTVRDDQITSAVAFLSATALAAISLVLDGHKTWREAGADAAELLLRALGVSPEEAQAIATSELRSLPASGQ